MASNNSTNTNTPDWLLRLQSVLHVRDEDWNSIQDLLLHELGLQDFTHLAHLQASDLNNNDSSTIPPVLQRGLMELQEYSERGGAIEDVASVTQVRHLLRAARLSPMGTIAPSNPELVYLNVGGFSYTTTRTTLCRVKGSVLEAMFSGRHSNNALQDTNGIYQLDRNGTHFGYILDYLRCGAVVSLPDTELARRELLVEAEYYGLDALHSALKFPHLRLETILPQPVRLIRQEEDAIRDMFCKGRPLTSPHHGLLKLFHSDDVAHPLTYQPQTFDGCSVLMDVRDNTKMNDKPVAVSSLSQFELNFDRKHTNILDRLSDLFREGHLIIAGGSVLCALTSSETIRTNQWWRDYHFESGMADKSDVDLFVCCRTPSEATSIARRVYYALAVNDESWVISRTRGVISINQYEGWGEFSEKVQVVLRLYDSPSEVLMGFDVDCCCCAYDGNNVWVTRRWLFAMQHGSNFLNSLHAWPNKASYELRLAKYAYRGYSVVVPGLDTKLVKADITKVLLQDLKGLARLLKVSDGMTTPIPMRRFPEHPRHVGQISSNRSELTPLVVALSSGEGGYNDQDDEVLLPSIFGRHDMMLWYVSLVKLRCTLTFWFCLC